MGISLFGNSGDKITQNTSVTTTISDSGNQSYTASNAWSNAFNTAVSFGPDPATAGNAMAGGSSGVANLGPYLMAAALIFGGFYLLNRK